MMRRALLSGLLLTLSLVIPLGNVNAADVRSSWDYNKLSDVTDPNIWRAVEGWYNYRVEYTKVHGLPLPKLRSAAEKAGKKIAFSVDE